MQEYDDYEDLDEYEEDGEEQEEDEEEAPQPTEEELDYLELRQRLKEAIRKQIKKESGSTNPQEKKKKLPYDNYGSFFGPSQPVIAQRVIQESKSLLENQHLAAKASTSRGAPNKNPASAAAGSKTRPKSHPPKVNEFKMKVQKLKDTRDYSFLLSDDVELPAPKKDPPRNVSVPHSDARSTQGPLKSRPTSNSGNSVRNGREERKPMSKDGQMQQSKNGPNRLASASKLNLTSTDSRRQLGSNNGNGPGRPLPPKNLPPKTPPATMQKKVYAPGAKNSVSGVQRPPSSKLNSSVPKRPLEPRKEVHESSRGKIMPKQPVPSSKPQINKPPPKIASRATGHQERPKKKPVRQYSDEDDSDDGGKAISMIRRMFNYNPRGFNDRDDDDSDMEANFDDILREEKRSAKIAKREDEEELRKIEEEERRERLRKEAKKRKLSQR